MTTIRRLVLRLLSLFRSGGAGQVKEPHRAAPGFAGLAIGLALTLIHLISIPVTNTSVNPARSTGPALFVGGWALSQLWLFWVMPIVGAAAAGFLYRFMLEGRREPASPPASSPA